MEPILFTSGVGQVPKRKISRIQIARELKASTECIEDEHSPS